MARAIKHIKAGLLNFEIIGTIPEHEPGRRSGRCRTTRSAKRPERAAPSGGADGPGKENGVTSGFEPVRFIDRAELEGRIGGNDGTTD